MDRATLLGVDRETLVALILQQETIAALTARVAELEAVVARLGGPPKTPANSSVPPSAGPKPNRAARRRKRGPKRGHAGISHRRQRPDMVVRCRPSTCAGCGAGLAVRGQRRVRRSQVIDLVPARPVVIEAWGYAARCTACGTRTVAALPAGLEPTRTFGPTVEATLGYLHQRHQLGYERLVEVCGALFQLRISEGGIANALRRLAERARPTYEAIGAAVWASPVIGSDETSARVDGRTWWQWVFQTPTASYHVLAPTRAARVIDAFLGGVEPVVWVADLYAAQVGTPSEHLQLCLAHQLRELTYATEADERLGQGWAADLRHVFGRAIRLHRERAQIRPASFANRRTRVIKAAERLIFGPPLGTGVAWKLQQRYRRHWDALFVFLHRSDVEPTNNGSERDLRNSVVHRKVSGGYRSAWGAEAAAILTSLLTTARKRGDNLYAALRAVAGSSPLRAAGMPT